MEHLLDDDLLCHEERITLSRLLASQNARRADREQEALQAELRQMIDERRQVIDPIIKEKAALDQQPFVSAQQKDRRRTVTLGPVEALPEASQPQPSKVEVPVAPVIPVVPVALVAPVCEPAVGALSRLRQWFKNLVIRNL